MICNKKYGCTFEIDLHLKCNLIFFTFKATKQLNQGRNIKTNIELNGYERILTDRKLVDFVFFFFVGEMPDMFVSFGDVMNE